MLAACQPPPSATPIPAATATATIPSLSSPTPTEVPNTSPLATPTPTLGPLPQPTPTPTLTPTPSPSPTATPTPVPPPSATPTANPTPTPIPTLTPAPTITTTSNLTWTTPREWQAPLSLTNTRGQQGGNTASLSQLTYVSWAVTNTGPFTLNRPFDIHLYLDDVFLDSWRPTGLSVDFFSFVDDWDELASHIRLTPGNHTLKLVIDPYEEIPETDETDNVYELTVSITGDLTPRPETRLPDIAPVALDGWDGPVVFNSYEGRTTNGPLSTDSTTYVSFAAENVGVSSALNDVTVHLYLDDILASRLTWRWLDPPPPRSAPTPGLGRASRSATTRAWRTRGSDCSRPRESHPRI